MQHWLPSMTHRLALPLQHHLPRFKLQQQLLLAHLMRHNWAQSQRLQCPHSDLRCMPTHLAMLCPADQALLMHLLTHHYISSLGYAQQPSPMLPMHPCQALDLTISILRSRAWLLKAQQQLVPSPQRLLTGLGALIMAWTRLLAIGLLGLPQLMQGLPAQPRLKVCITLQKSLDTGVQHRRVTCRPHLRLLLPPAPAVVRAHRTCQKEQGSERRRLHIKRPKLLLETERVLCQLIGVGGLVVVRRTRAPADGQLSMPTDRPEKQLKEQLQVHLGFKKPHLLIMSGAQLLEHVGKRFVSVTMMLTRGCTAGDSSGSTMLAQPLRLGSSSHRLTADASRFAPSHLVVANALHLRCCCRLSFMPAICMPKGFIAYLMLLSHRLWHRGVHCVLEEKDFRSYVLLQLASQPAYCLAHWLSHYIMCMHITSECAASELQGCQTG